MAFNPGNKNEMKGQEDSTTWPDPGYTGDKTIDLPDGALVSNGAILTIKDGYTVNAKKKISVDVEGTIIVGDNCTLNVHTGIEVGDKSTLEINPGVKLFFAKYTDYRDGLKSGVLYINGGILRAIGNDKNRIWFTSMDSQPANGDWGGVIFANPPKGSELKYVVIEYSMFGVEQIWDEKDLKEKNPPNPGVDISKSIIRYVNIEGIYAERCEFTVEDSLFYQCGNHEIALEHENNTDIKGCLFHTGRSAIAILDSNVDVIGCYFYDYASLKHYEGIIIKVSDWLEKKAVCILGNKLIGPDGQQLAEGKRPEGVKWPKDYLFENNTHYKTDGCPSNDIIKMENELTAEAVKSGTVSDVFRPGQKKLGYIPGDAGDEYPYIYARSDPTRCRVDILGAKEGWSWGLTYADRNLWFFGFHAFTALNIDTKKAIYYRLPSYTRVAGLMEAVSYSPFSVPSQALAFDGTSFWTTLDPVPEIVRFRVGISPKHGPIVLGATKYARPEDTNQDAIACDSTKLYLLGETGEFIYSYKNPTATNYPIDPLGENEKPKNRGGKLSEQHKPPQKVEKIGFFQEIKSTGKLESYRVGRMLCMHGDLLFGEGEGPKTIKMFRLKSDRRCSGSRCAILEREAYPVAFNILGMAWGADHLWTMQTTCEAWGDLGHIFKIKLGPCVPVGRVLPNLLPDPPLVRPIPVIQPEIQHRGMQTPPPEREGGGVGDQIPVMDVVDLSRTRTT
jgi:hypothetical protein